MDIQKHSYFIPTLLAFWLTISFFSVMGQYHGSYQLASHYVIALSQIIFDCVAFYFFVGVIKKTSGDTKIINIFFCIALLSLLISDFFYNAINLHWLSVSAAEVNVYPNAPLAIFCVFMLLGFIHVTKTIKVETHHTLFHLLALLAIIFILVSFFFFVPTDVEIAGTSSHSAFAVLTVLQALGVLFALIAMAKENTRSMNVIVIGFLTIFFAGMFFNINDKIGTYTSDYILEIIWVLGNVLLAAGAYLRFKSE